MPRRNRRDRPSPRDPEPRPDGFRPLTFEAMARELVKAGKCSPLILDHPMHPTERKPA